MERKRGGIEFLLPCLTCARIRGQSDCMGGEREGDWPFCHCEKESENERQRGREREREFRTEIRESTRVCVYA